MRSWNAMPICWALNYAPTIWLFADIIVEKNSVKGCRTVSCWTIRCSSTLFCIIDFLYIRYGLTGTPLQNKLEEFWCVLDWANPGSLGSAKNFNQEFGKPMLKGQTFDATKRELAVGRKSEFFKFTPHILGGGNLARKFCGNPLIWRICDIQYFAGKKIRFAITESSVGH